MEDLNNLQCSEEHSHIHIHDGEHDHVHSHNHGDSVHIHAHTHAQTRNVVNRLSKAIGHLEAVKRMVEEERDCTEVLIQLAAVRSALSSTAKVILKDHIDHCLTGASEGDTEELAALNEAIDKYIS